MDAASKRLLTIASVYQLPREFESASPKIILESTYWRPDEFRLVDKGLIDDDIVGKQTVESSKRLLIILDHIHYKFENTKTGLLRVFEPTVLHECSSATDKCAEAVVDKQKLEIGHVRGPLNDGEMVLLRK